MNTDMENDLSKMCDFYREVFAESSGTAPEDWSDNAVVYRCLELDLVDRSFITRNNVPGFNKALLDKLEKRLSSNQHRNARLSSKRVHAHAMPQPLTDRELFEFIRDEMKVSKYKREQVEEELQEFMEGLLQCERLAELFGEDCPVDAQPIGSSVEGTRCFDPNEFDYLLTFYPNIEHLNEAPYLKDFLFRVTDEGCAKLEDRVQLDEYGNSGHLYMLSDRAKTAVYDVIEEELRHLVTDSLKSHHWPRFVDEIDEVEETECD